MANSRYGSQRRDIVERRVAYNALKTCILYDRISPELTLKNHANIREAEFIGFAEPDRWWNVSIREKVNAVDALGPAPELNLF